MDALSPFIFVISIDSSMGSLVIILALMFSIQAMHDLHRLHASDIVLSVLFLQATPLFRHGVTVV